jgi:4-hydroxybenzoate polyprenyltransferase
MIKTKISNYLSLVTFSHTIFAMPFAIIGYFLAVSQMKQSISWYLLLMVVLCMIFARNAAMAFNRFADRHFDSLNPRTALREIPLGIIKPGSAMIFTMINSALFIATTWFINTITFRLSPVALLIILGYSLTKRFTVFCHFVLGLGLSLAPIGAYLAVTGSFNWLPLIFSGIVLFWVSGFDIVYALQDDDFDKNYSLKSLPALLGRKRAILLSSVLHVFSALLVVLAGITSKSGTYYWVGSTIFISLLIYQHLLIRPDKLNRINLAFATLNGIASVIFATFVVIDLMVINH